MGCGDGRVGWGAVVSKDGFCVSLGPGSMFSLPYIVSLFVRILLLRSWLLSSATDANNLWIKLLLEELAPSLWGEPPAWNPCSSLRWGSLLSPQGRCNHPSISGLFHVLIVKRILIFGYSSLIFGLRTHSMAADNLDVVELRGYHQ